MDPDAVRESALADPMPPIFETSAGIEPVGARCQPEMGLCVTGLNNTLSKGH